MRSTLLLIAATTFLTACTTPATIRVAGGDQSQGTVVMAYDYSLMQSPKADWQQGLQKASGQCQNWGYNGAIPAGKPSQSCMTETQDGDCIGWTISADFQCTTPAQQQ